MSNINTLCIALYDFPKEQADMKRFFTLMEALSDQVGVPWESMGLTTSAKLVQFKNGKRKAEKINFQGLEDIALMGGVYKPGTFEDWRTYASLDADTRGHMVVCLEEALWQGGNLALVPLLKDLLSCAPFAYGTVYERDRDLGPEWYAVGINAITGRKRLSQQERDELANWGNAYESLDGDYRTGLLRDVFPHNILTAPHLGEKVGGLTLGEWIQAASNRGTLTPLTPTHTLWSVDPQDILQVREALQEAGLLLCFKP